MLTEMFKPRPKAGADPAARLEQLTAADLPDLLQHPFSVLILTRTQCPWCQYWHQELSAFFQKGGADWTRGLRFGMLPLDQPGFTEFKRNNPWIKDQVKLVPYNALYLNGQMKSGFPGAELTRLARSVKRVRKEVSMPMKP